MERIFPAGSKIGRDSIAKLIVKLRTKESELLAFSSLDAVLEKAEKVGRDEQAVALLREYRNNDWWFEEIRKIEDLGEMEVFDPINVQGTHSYLTEGLVSHNSWVETPAFAPAVRHENLKIGESWTGKTLKARVPHERLKEAARE